jgi:hypothetical protein
MKCKGGKFPKFLSVWHLGVIVVSIKFQNVVLEKLGQ